MLHLLLVLLMVPTHHLFPLYQKQSITPGLTPTRGSCSTLKPVVTVSDSIVNVTPPPCASDGTNSSPVSTVIESTAGLTLTWSHQVNSTLTPVAVKSTVKVTPHSDTISKYLVQYVPPQPAK